jgi:large subunit ribosomal protein L37Ae
MVASTKKLGPAGRFGARYGALARKQVTTVERVQRAKHACKRCGAIAVVRIHTAIWECRKCDFQFAGGAYVPETGAGKGAQKALRGIRDKLIRGIEDDKADEIISFTAAVAEVEAEAAGIDSDEEA